MGNTPQMKLAEIYSKIISKEPYIDMAAFFEKYESFKEYRLYQDTSGWITKTRNEHRKSFGSSGRDYHFFDEFD